MKKKKKFVVFLLSVIPGLSHFYLGLANRGLIFLGAVAANIIGVVMLVTLTIDDFMVLLMGLPVIWFLALIDSMMWTDRINRSMAKKRAEDEGEKIEQIDDEKKEDMEKDMNIQNKKVLTCLLSFIPGAGHMYLGYKRQGLELMTLFFFSFFFVDWLRISFFMFIIPVIWFYSMFDALDKASGAVRVNGEEDSSIIDTLISEKPGLNASKLLGYAFICVGLLLIFDRIISPMISYQIRSYLQTGIVAVLFILGGVKLLMGNRVEGKEREEAEKNCADGE